MSHQTVTDYLNDLYAAALPSSADTLTKMAEADDRRERQKINKRNQRLRDRVNAASGKANLTSETISHALLDALAITLRQGDKDGHAAAIIEMASSAFVFPPQAVNVLTRKLRTRLPHILDKSL